VRESDTKCGRDAGGGCIAVGKLRGEQEMQPMRCSANGDARKPWLVVPVDGVVDAPMDRLSFAVLAQRPQWDRDCSSVHSDDDDQGRGKPRGQRSKIRELLAGGERPQPQVGHGMAGGADAAEGVNGVHRLTAATCHCDGDCREGRTGVLRVYAVTEDLGSLGACHVAGACNRLVARYAPVDPQREICRVLCGVQANHALEPRLPSWGPGAINRSGDG